MRAHAVEEKAKSEGEGGVGGPMVGFALAEPVTLYRQDPVTVYRQEPVGEKDFEGTEASQDGTKKTDESSAKKSEEKKEQPSDLDAWRAGVTVQVDSIQAQKGLSGASTKTMQSAAGASKARSAETGSKAPESIKAVLPLVPKAVAPPPPPVNPVPQATQLVEAASGRRLTDQVLPNIKNPPLRPGGMLQVIRPPVLSPEYATRIATVEEREAEVATGTPDHAKADAINACAAAGAQLSSRGDGDMLVLIDEGKPPPKPIPPGKKSDIAGVLAVILADIEPGAWSIVERAAVEAYPEGVLLRKFPQFVDDLAPRTEAVLRAQIEEIREQADISIGELDAKLAVRRAQIVELEATAIATTFAEGAAEAEAIREAGQEALDAQAGARSAADQFIEQQQEAASGGVDPAVIRAKARRLKRELYRDAARQEVAYEQAGERRLKALSASALHIIKSYDETASDEAAAVYDAHIANGASEMEAKQAAARLLQWGRARGAETDEIFQTLQEEASTEAKRFATEVRVAGEQGVVLIDAWAAEEIAAHASFWDQIVDWMQNWTDEASARADAWEEVHATATKDAILGDLAMLSQIEGIEAADINVAALSEVEDLTAEQRVVLKMYFTGWEAGNPLVAIATGIAHRLYAQLKPGLLEDFTKRLVEAPDEQWEQVALIGKAENSEFKAFRIASDVYKALDHWFDDDEALIFRALDSLTPIQVAAVRKCYQFHFHGDIEEDLKSKLDGLEEDRALALLESDRTKADVAALAYAIADSDEDTIARVLRGKKPEQLAAFRDLFVSTHGRTIEECVDLNPFASTSFKDRTKALAAGETAKADAIAMRSAVHDYPYGLTNVTKIKGIYTQVAAEVEAEGDRKIWRSDEIATEIRRRNHEIENAFQKMSGSEAEVGAPSALSKAFDRGLLGASHDLVLALHAGDQSGVDAARLKSEEQDTWSDDDAVLNVVRAQVEKARKDVMRDFGSDKEDWIYDRTGKYFGSLAEKFGGPGEMRDFIETDVTGFQHDEAMTLLDHRGKLLPEQELDFAIRSEDAERIEDLLSKRTLTELVKLQGEWQSGHPGEDFEESILDAVSGRNYDDVKLHLEGKPMSPEAKFVRAEKRFMNEIMNGGAAFAAAMPQLERLLVILNRLGEQKEKLVAEKPGTDEYAVEERHFNLLYEVFDEAIDDVRSEVDEATEIAVNIVTVAFVIGSFGAGAVAVGVLSPLASIATKFIMKQGAYGAREFRNDALAALPELVLHIPAASKLFLKPVAPLLGKLEQGGGVSRLFGAGIKEGYESLPSTVLSASLNESNLRSENTGMAIIEEVEGETAKSVFTGSALHLGGELLGSVQHVQQTGRPPSEMLALVSPMQEKAVGYHEYQKSNPGKSYLDYLETVRASKIDQQAAADKHHQEQRALRKQFLSNVPEELRKLFNGVPFEALSDAQFDMLTGGSKAQSAIVTSNGKTRVVVRKSPDPKLLSEESPHLAKAFETIAKKDVPKVEATTDVPKVEATTDVPKAEVTEDVPKVEVTEDVPKVEATKDVPKVEVTKDIPKTDATKDIPKPDLTVPANWKDLDLKAKVEWSKTTLGLQIDAQRRAIDDVERQLAAGPDEATRKALLTQLEDVSANLDHLRKLLDKFASYAKANIKRLETDGATRDYLRQPSLLFAGKPGVQGGGGREASLKDLEGGPSPLQESPSDEVYQRGEQWEEGRGKKKRRYRAVERWKGGVMIDGYQEALDIRGFWGMRGKERTLKGEIAEETSLEVSRKEIDELKKKGLITISVPGEAHGLDEALIHFEGNQARIVVVEVKDESGAVALAKFTAVQDMNASLKRLRKRLFELREAGDLSQEHWKQANDAIDAKHFELEIRLGPEASVSQKVIDAIRDKWQATGYTAVDIRTRSIEKHQIDEAKIVVLAGKIKEALSAGQRKIVQLTPPIIESKGGLHQDSNGKLFSIMVADVAKTPTDSHAKLAARICNALESDAKLLVGEGMGPVHVIVDRSLLTAEDLKKLHASLEKQAKTIGLSPERLERLTWLK